MRFGAYGMSMPSLASISAGVSSHLYAANGNYATRIVKGVVATLPSKELLSPILKDEPTLIFQQRAADISTVISL